LSLVLAALSAELRKLLELSEFATLRTGSVLFATGCRSKIILLLQFFLQMRLQVRNTIGDEIVGASAALGIKRDNLPWRGLFHGQIPISFPPGKTMKLVRGLPMEEIERLG
jgi:hypothetical protein